MKAVLRIALANLKDASAMPVVVDVEQFDRRAAYGGRADEE